jgi:DNA polymerase-3 subunit delta'
LLAGPAGVGKGSFARALAQAALCSQRSAAHHACGACQSCRLLLAGSHPDLRVLEASSPEEQPAEASPPAGSTTASRVIGVDRIRELRDFTELSSHLSGCKVVIIEPADRLHPSAANALLKTLEEPSTGTVFILVSARLQQLLPTIRSRCFRLDFHVPGEAEASKWLEEQGVEDPRALLAYAGGAPLAALELARSPLWRRRPDLIKLLADRNIKAGTLARAIDPDDVGAFCRLLYKWCADLIAMRLAGRVRYNPDCAQSLAALAVNLDVLKLQRLLKELTVQMRYLEHPLNQKLVTEKAALSYTRALSPQVS